MEQLRTYREAAFDSGDSPGAEIPATGRHAARTRFRSRALRAIVLGLFLALGAVLWWAQSGGLVTIEAILAVIQKSSLAAPGVFVLAYAVLTIFMLPALPLNLAAGVVWGSYLGGGLSALGATLGAVASFWLARLEFGQPLADIRAYRALNWVNERIRSSTWQTIAFVRINPLFPTGPLNYVFGISPARFSTYAWATLVFLLPPSVLVAAIGEMAGTYALSGEMERLLHRGSLLVGAAAMVGFAWFLLRRREHS